MTCIAIRSGIIAADSRVTHDSESGGTRVFTCEKLFRKFANTKDEAILGVYGDAFASMVFVDWYGSCKKKPTELTEGGAEFGVIVLTHKGLFEYDQWCRGVRVLEKFYAVGCGAKAALGAMHRGANAHEAVRIACKVDPFCGPPVIVWKLGKLPKA